MQTETSALSLKRVNRTSPLRARAMCVAGSRPIGRKYSRTSAGRVRVPPEACKYRRPCGEASCTTNSAACFSKAARRGRVVAWSPELQRSLCVWCALIGKADAAVLFPAESHQGKTFNAELTELPEHITRAREPPLHAGKHRDHYIIVGRAANGYKNVTRIKRVPQILGYSLPSMRQG